MTVHEIISSIFEHDVALRKRQAAQDALWKKFGLAVREVRRAKRIQLKTFSADLGVTPAMVSMMETGQRAWSTHRARKAVELISRETPIKS